MPAPWSITNTPSTAAQATAGQAAPTSQATTGLCTRLRALQCFIATGATAQTPLQLVVRDGATGSGAIIWSASLAAPANSVAAVTESDLDLRATPGNALTVEFTGAGVAASQETVNAQGDMVAVGYPAFGP